MPSKSEVIAEVKEKIAKKLAYLALRDEGYEDFSTEKAVWEWVVQNNFVKEYMADVDRLFQEVPELVILDPDQSLPEIRFQPELAHCSKSCHVVEQSNMERNGFLRVIKPTEGITQDGKPQGNIR